MSTPDRPDRSRNRDEATPNDAREQPAAGGQDRAPSSDDFGAFVSASVRQSFQRLKGSAPPDNAAPSDETSSRRSRTRSQPARHDTARPRPLGGPVGRKWRDTAPGAGPTVTEVPGPEAAAGEPAAVGAAGFDAREWMRGTFGDENGPARRFLAAIAVAILIVLVIIFLFFRGGGGNEGADNPTPTQTTTSVLSTDRTATPAQHSVAPTRRASVTPQSGENGQSSEPTSTPRVREGGDNQLD